MKEGRNFSDNITGDQADAVLVNETLGKSWAVLPKTVIGVFKGLHTYSFQHKVEPLILVLPLNSVEQSNPCVRPAKGNSFEGLA